MGRCGKPNGKLYEVLWAPFLHGLYTHLQLKSTYNAIQNYQGRSGIHWDNVNGANIVEDADISVWDGFIVKKVCYHDLLILTTLTT